MDWKLALQIVGIVLGLLYLWLEYRANVWLWVVGMIMPLVHGALYFQSGLYADCAMEIYYVAASVYGLAVWLCQPARRAKKGDNYADIRHTPLQSAALLATVYLLLHGGIYGLLVRFTDSTVPFWDSMTTALCIVAMFMLSRKYVEQWLVWLVIDIVSAVLYVYKGIPLTAGLYALYSVLAVAGYMRWRKAMQQGVA